MQDAELPEVSILEGAARIPPDQRGPYLDQACGNDVELRQRVERLLNALDRAGGFLAPVNLSQFAWAGLSSCAPTGRPGDRIGRYKLLEQIGEGGCGVIFMAEQVEPVRRRVAVKVIKLGMDTNKVIARFEAERQALALMDHPNIAKVLDAGATDTGRPYFVMELVRGAKITEFCDQHRLSPEARLKLFIQVCQAVQHAHQKGVIHRDLKPSNILVTIHDDEPVPKVIDFGIAKATSGQQLTDKTVFTAFEQFIGTPAYMSPEQALMTSNDIDTRSDIYSLGVLLYELLTGRPPFEEKALLQRGIAEMMRVLREEEPLRPSTRLGTLEAAALTTTARQRQTEPPRLLRVVRGDLDWITMKCLEKDRKRRYETANGLAADIQRCLKHEPVVARPPSKLYEFQKTVRRHRFGFAATGGLILVLAAGVLASTWQAVRATRAERTQADLRQAAEAARANESALRQKMEVRVTVAQARTLLDQGRPDEAEQLLQAIDPALVEPDAIHANVLRQIAWQRVLKNNWPGAVTNLALLLQVDGAAWDREIASDYYFYGTALVSAGDASGYEHFRQVLLERFTGTPDPALAEYCCLMALLKPVGPEMLSGLESCYETAGRRQDYPAERAQEMNENAMRRALVDYRRGDFVRADELIQPCLQPVRDPTIRPAALAIRAMILHKLGDEEEAQLALDAASGVIDPIMKTGPSAFNARQLSQQGRYYEWVQANIFLEEAMALLGIPAQDARKPTPN